MKGIAELSVTCLVLQNVMYVLFLRASQQGEHNKYLSSTAVLLGECSKVVISLVVMLFQGISVKEMIKFFTDVPFSDHFLLAVPAMLYMFQNNLYFVALNKLDAASYQILAQTKILTTGLFSVLFLRRELSRLQWMALVLLLTGVVNAQLPVPDCSKPEPIQATEQRTWSNQFVGVLACTVISVLSGFASVYTEKVVKKDPNRSLFYSQIQLGLWSILSSIFNVLGTDAVKISKHGFFHGYDYLTWIVIIWGAGGGLLVAVVMKYTSSLAKTYAVSCAIFITGLYNAIVLGEDMRASFWLSAVVVAISVILYNNSPVQLAQQQSTANNSSSSSNPAALLVPVSPTAQSLITVSSSSLGLDAAATPRKVSIALDQMNGNDVSSARDR